MNLLSPCLTAEAARSRSFKGVTLTFVVTAVGAGRAGRGARGSRQRGAAEELLAERALHRSDSSGTAARRVQVSYPMLIRR